MTRGPGDPWTCEPAVSRVKNVLSLQGRAKVRGPVCRKKGMNTNSTPTEEPTPVEFDPNLPTFEVWVNGRRFASTQVPAQAFRLLKAMANGRPSHQPPELRVINDRRSETRSAKEIQS